MTHRNETYILNLKHKVLGFKLSSLFPLLERQIKFYLFFNEVQNFHVNEWLQKV